MKISLFILFIALSLSSFGQIVCVTAQDSNQIEVLNSNPLHGSTYGLRDTLNQEKTSGRIVFHQKNDSLKVYEQCQYINGLKHGHYLRYYDNENLCTIGEYKKGEPTGLWQVFLKDGTTLAYEYFDTDEGLVINNPDHRCKTLNCLKKRKKIKKHLKEYKSSMTAPVN